MDPRLADLIHRGRPGRVVVLTGAGISAESRIPTFRGPEGYWTVGAAEYHPQELATHASFSRMPRDVWHWYLYRRSVCQAAVPNAGHHAIAQLEQGLGARFVLVTQNVDGLHIRAGNSLDRTCQIHGNIDFMRCTRPCTSELFPIPAHLPPKTKADILTEEEFGALHCPRCRAPSRPHVLWFDECYEEALFRSSTAMEAAARCDFLLIVGSSGTTNLPIQVLAQASRNGAAIVDVNPEDNPFGAYAEQSGGFWARGPAGEQVPAIVAALLAE